MIFMIQDEFKLRESTDLDHMKLKINHVNSSRVIGTHNRSLELIQSHQNS